MEITGRGKSTVYHHIKDTPLSATKQKQIAKESSVRAIALAATRKGVAARPFTPFSVWTPQRVLLVAHLIFDGEIMRSKCIYHNRSAALRDRVTTLMRELYQYPPSLNTNTKTGVTRVQFFNVALAVFLHTKATELLESIELAPRVQKKEFLRAFFDDEGCMDFRPQSAKRTIRGYQNDQQILSCIKDLLQDFSIEAQVRKPNEVVIAGKENLLQFQKTINFSKGVCINPNRTNSIWKKNLEKRQLLTMAIDSYQS